MPSNALPDHVQQMITQIATEYGFKKLRAETEGGSEQGDNYLGQLYRTSLYDDGDTTKEKMNLIIKCSPRNPARRELLHTHDLFKNEIFMYEEVLPALLQGQKLRGIVPKTQQVFPFTAKTYASRTSKDGAEDTIIMENVAPQGFKMADRFVGMDGEHCRIVVRDLARYHATSLMLKADEPELYNSLVAKSKEVLFIPEWEPSFKAFANRAKPMIDARFPIGTPKRAKFEKFADNFFQHMSDLVKPDPHLSVFCHGDAWINNYLFKYKKNSSVPEEVFIIDFQLSRYACPVTDLSYMIFCSTTKEVRDKHFKQLLKDYHNFLSGFLKEFGYPQDKIVSWDVMQDLYRKYMNFGLGMAFIGLPVFLSKKGDVKGVDEVGDAKQVDEVFVDTSEENPARDERMSDVVHDMIEYGYI